MKRLTWQQVEPFISDTLREDGPEIKGQVDRGEAVALKLGDCYLVGRGEGLEFVVMCLQGKNARGELRKFSRHLKGAGFMSVRLHTQRKGLNRLLNSQLKGLVEFEEVETVYRGYL